MNGEEHWMQNVRTSDNRHDASRDWIRAFLLAIVTMAIPWLIPTTWGLVCLLLVYGTPYALVHSIWVGRLEWVGEPPDFVAGVALAVLFYTVVFRVFGVVGRRVLSRAWPR
jgi:hypothetical protein